MDISTIPRKLSGEQRIHVVESLIAKVSLSGTRMHASCGDDPDFVTCALLNFEAPFELLLHQNVHQIVAVMYILYVHSDILLISVLAFAAL